MNHLYSIVGGALLCLLPVSCGNPNPHVSAAKSSGCYATRGGPAKVAEHITPPVEHTPVLAENLQPRIWREEILATERRFAIMAAEQGIGPAFTFFADEHAVIQRNEGLIRGRDSIALFYMTNARPDRQEKLSWTPAFVEVSSSGDLAYTYGGYL
ncbi:MAG: hypothetical protein R2751_07460 [Bacteroidales bacterium]